MDGCINGWINGLVNEWVGGLLGGLQWDDGDGGDAERDGADGHVGGGLECGCGTEG